MNSKLVAFVALALVLAGLFVRLGFWQLERRAERRALNAAVERQLAFPPSVFADAVKGPNPINRRARVQGMVDYENEFVLTGRSRNGSPGVHIFTPVRLAGRDSAVLVNRGWVYSPDAATIDLKRWREDRADFSGYTQQIAAGGTPGMVRGRGLRPLLQDGVRDLVPYPVEAVYLVARDSGGADGPARLPEPALDEGTHLSYAIQWFCFAAIALGGSAIVVRRALAAPPLARLVHSQSGNRE